MRTRNHRSRDIRWARYVNRYAHIDEVAVGGSAYRRLVWQGMLGRDHRAYLHVRKQHIRGQLKAVRSQQRERGER